MKRGKRLTSLSLSLTLAPGPCRRYRSAYLPLCVYKQRCICASITSSLPPHKQQHSNHSVQHFAFLHLTIYLGDCFISGHKELPHSFLTAIKISILRMDCNLSEQSPLDGHSGCLQSSVIINRAAVNSLVHPTLHTYIRVCLWNPFQSSGIYGSMGT